MAKQTVTYSSYKDVPIDNLKLVIKEGAISVDKLEKIQKVNPLRRGVTGLVSTPLI